MVCPVCEISPPLEAGTGARRWRWLSVHLAKHKAGDVSTKWNIIRRHKEEP